MYVIVILENIFFFKQNLSNFKWNRLHQLDLDTFLIRVRIYDDINLVFIFIIFFKVVVREINEIRKKTKRISRNTMVKNVKKRS